MSEVKLTDSQRAALTWLRRHGSDGLFCKDGVLMACGERAPFMRSTWNALVKEGVAEFYGDGRGRIRLTGNSSAVHGVSDEDLEKRQAAMSPHPMDDGYPENSNHD